MPKVLLAEDNELNRDMLPRRLKRLRFDVALEGWSAIRQITALPKPARFQQ